MAFLGRKKVGNRSKLQIFLRGASKSQAENPLGDDMSWLHSSTKCPQAPTLHLQRSCRAEVIQLCPSPCVCLFTHNASKA